VDRGSNASGFNHIAFSNNGRKTFYNASTVNGNMTINGGSGAVNVDTWQITGVGGANTFNSFGTLEIRGTSHFPQGFETILLASTSMVDYRSDLDQDIYATQYGNLRMRSVSGVATEKTALGDLTILGSWYMNSDAVTTFDAAANDIYITLTGNLAINAGCDIIWGTGTSTLEHVGGNWNIDADLDSLNNLILNGTGDKWTQGDLLIGGDVLVKSNIDLRMYQNNNTTLYHRMTGLPAKGFSVENGGRVMNSTPGTIAPAIPEGFGTYLFDDNSTYYLNSPAGTDQIVYTGSSVQYGNLNFNNAKNVTSDGIAELHIDGSFDMNDATYLDNGQDTRIGGPNIYLTYYVPSAPTVEIILDGLQNQYVRDDRENILLLPAITFAGTGTKTYGDGNDVATIDGDLTVNSGVTATSGRNVTFNGTNWTNNGIYTQTGNTLTFNGASGQSIKSGEADPANYFRNLNFTNTSTKTFITDGADINGTFTLTSGTVDLGSLSHTLTGSVINTTGGTLISDAANLILDGGNQNINSPAFEINDITCSGNGTKRMFSDWTVNDDLTINSGCTFNTSDNVIPTYYDIYIKGDWSNSGNFVDNSSEVTFDGSASPILITSGQG